MIIDDNLANNQRYPNPLNFAKCTSDCVDKITTLYRKMFSLLHNSPPNIHIFSIITKRTMKQYLIALQLRLFICNEIVKLLQYTH